MSQRAIEKWKIELLFVSGYSARKVARMVLGNAELVGQVHALVRKKGLTAIREGDGRAGYLVSLEARAPYSMRGDVAKMVDAMAMEAGRLLSADRTHRDIALDRDLGRSELRKRLSLPAEMDRLRQTIVSERIEILEVRNRSGLEYNVADCSLAFLGSKGLLPEWAVQAGLRLRQDRLAAGAGLSGMDYTKQKVDGGRAPGIGDGVLDAMQRGADAVEAVRYAFHGDELLPTRLDLLEHVVVHDRRIREFIGMPKAAMTSASSLLAQTLQAVAFIYKLAPSGSVANRLASWRPGRAKSDLEQRQAGLLEEAILAHRMAKMEA